MKNCTAHYAKSHQRNIRKAKDAGNIVRKNIPVTDVIFLAKEQAKNFSPITDKDYENLSKLFAILQKKNMADYLWNLFTSTTTWSSSCGWFFSHGRAYYILVGNHPNGRIPGRLI